MTFIFKAFTGFETNNKYKICNSMGQQVYFAAEGILNKSNNNIHLFNDVVRKIEIQVTVSGFNPRLILSSFDSLF